MKEHYYKVKTNWSCEDRIGTKNYHSYSRSFSLSATEKDFDIAGSSDPAFLGDPTKYNPEELLVASISSCHMLWYLHLCATSEITVLKYQDNAIGIMTETVNGSGKFENVTLHPVVSIKEENMKKKALLLHKKANEMCFIANSCNFPVHHKTSILVENQNE